MGDNITKLEKMLEFAVLYLLRLISKHSDCADISRSFL